MSIIVSQTKAEILKCLFFCPLLKDIHFIYTIDIYYTLSLID